MDIPIISSEYSNCSELAAKVPSGKMFAKVLMDLSISSTEAFPSYSISGIDCSGATSELTSWSVLLKEAGAERVSDLSCFFPSTSHSDVFKGCIVSIVVCLLFFTCGTKCLQNNIKEGYCINYLSAYQKLFKIHIYLTLVYLVLNWEGLEPLYFCSNVFYHTGEFFLPSCPKVVSL